MKTDKNHSLLASFHGLKRSSSQPKDLNKLTVMTESFEKDSEISSDKEGMESLVPKELPST